MSTVATAAPRFCVDNKRGDDKPDTDHDRHIASGNPSPTLRGTACPLNLDYAKDYAADTEPTRPDLPHVFWQVGHRDGHTAHHAESIGMTQRRHKAERLAVGMIDLR